MKVKYLGQQTKPKLDFYSSDFLDSIPRNQNDLSKYFGVDYWNAYEFSYLNAKNHPVIEAIEIKIPMDSIFTVESKSLKIFLSSFYNKKFNNSSKAYKLIEKDLSLVLNSPVTVRRKTKYEDPPKSTLLHKINNKIPKNKIIQFQGFRSICPVTSQPDWGNIYIHSSSNTIEPKTLIKLLKSYRDKGVFHEACVESIFLTLLADFSIKDLTVYGKFLRRGGIDINPLRSTSKKLFFKNFRDFNQ